MLLGSLDDAAGAGCKCCFSLLARRDFLRAPLLGCKTPRFTALSILLYASAIWVFTSAWASGLGLAAYFSTAAKYFFIRVFTADLYALLRSRFRSAIWTRLIADLVFATVSFVVERLLLKKRHNARYTTIASISQKLLFLKKSRII